MSDPLTPEECAELRTDYELLIAEGFYFEDEVEAGTADGVRMLRALDTIDALRLELSEVQEVAQHAAGCLAEEEDAHVCALDTIDTLLGIGRKRGIEEFVDLLTMERDHERAFKEQHLETLVAVRRERDDLRVEVKRLEDHCALIARNYSQSITENVELQARAEKAEAEVERLRAHFDAAGDGLNLLAVLDLYNDRRISAEQERDDLRAEVKAANEAKHALAMMGERLKADKADLRAEVERLKRELADSERAIVRTRERSRTTTAIQFLRWDEQASLEDLHEMGDEDAIQKALKIARKDADLGFTWGEMRAAFKQLAREAAVDVNEPRAEARMTEDDG